MREKRSGPRLTVGTVAVVAALALTGCSTSEEEGPPEAIPEQSETTPEATATNVPALPVGEPFGEAVWGFQFAPHGTATTAPVVTGDRLVVLSGPDLLAYDTSGAQVWGATPDVLEGKGTDLVLRLVDEETVALITFGQSVG